MELMNFPMSRCCLFILAIAFLGGSALAASPTTAPATSYPLLDQLTHETQSVYADVQSGLVRVQLPPPKWMNELADKDSPLDKYPDLDPKVRDQLQQSRTEYQQGNALRPVNVVVTPATQPDRQPATAPAAGRPAAQWQVTAPPGTGEIIFQSPGPNGGTALQLRAGGEIDAAGHVARGSGLSLNFSPAAGFTPNNVGLLLDDKGHVLVPIYLEPDALPKEGVKVMVGDNALALATFVASDAQTQLTVLQLDKPQGKPIRWSAARPADGSLVMMLAPSTGSGRLELWSGGERDWGVVATVDGRVAGFDRYGQFLGGPCVQAVIEQLVTYHRVKRATVGIAVAELSKTDPQRQVLPALGSRPALRITAVTPASPAEKAGLHAGDLILALSNDPVGDTPTFAALLSARSGATPLRVLRGGQRLTITLELHAD